MLKSKNNAVESNSIFPTKTEIISCQLVTYNSEKTLSKCLDSLYSLSTSDFKINFILVDNASDDNSAKMIEEYFKKNPDNTISVYLEKNLGFSGGHNRALEESRKLGASFVALINPDLFLENDALIHLRRAFNQGIRTGAVCPKLYRSTDTDKENVALLFDSTGMYFYPTYRHFDRGSNEPVHNPDGSERFVNSEYISGSSGACVMFHMECIDSVSFPEDISPTNKKEFLDEGFFAYREDAELSLRLKLKGWQIKFEPNAKGFHVRQVLPDNRKEINSYINMLGVQNRFLLQIQTLPVSGFIFLFPMIVYRNILVLLACIIKERSSFIAFKNVFKLLPQSLKKRRWTLSDRKLSLITFLKIFFSGQKGKTALSRNHQLLQEKESPSLHISIVNFYHANLLEENLPDLLEKLNSDGIKSFKISIVNNSPDDKNYASLKEEFSSNPTIEFIDPGRNAGFATANNSAIKNSDKEILLLLNPDIKITAGAIKNSLDYFNYYQNLGTLSPLIMDSDTKEIQYRYLAKKLPSLITLISSMFFLEKIWSENPLSRHETYKDDFLLEEFLKGNVQTSDSGCFEIEQAAGACLFIRKSVFEKLDGLDENFYPAWFEDVDFAKRCLEHGFVNAITNNAVIYHDGGSSLSSLQRSYFLTIYFKNMLRYWKKHSNSSVAFILYSMMIFIIYSSRRSFYYLKTLFSNQKSDSFKSLFGDLRSILLECFK